MTTKSGLAEVFLDRLGLRQTSERRLAFEVLLERPGLSATECTRELESRNKSVDHRTIQRLFKIFWSREGCLARLQVVGPRWVCWGCGRAIADARTIGATAVRSFGGAIPVELGGYCSQCQTPTTSEEAGTTGRRATPPASWTSRRAPQIPIGLLYGNPNLMRELVGSNRRVAGRDYAIAVLAENPQAGPTASLRILEDELSVSLSLRTVKRYSTALRGPKAQMLFASCGAMGWKCCTCNNWGQISNVSLFQDSAPDGFTPTDATALCVVCYQDGYFSRRKSDK